MVELSTRAKLSTLLLERLWLFTVKLAVIKAEAWAVFASKTGVVKPIGQDCPAGIELHWLASIEKPLGDTAEELLNNA